MERSSTNVTVSSGAWWTELLNIPDLMGVGPTITDKMHDGTLDAELNHEEMWRQTTYSALGVRAEKTEFGIGESVEVAVEVNLPWLSEKLGTLDNVQVSLNQLGEKESSDVTIVRKSVKELMSAAKIDETRIGWESHAVIHLRASITISSELLRVRDNAFYDSSILMAALSIPRPCDDKKYADIFRTYAIASIVDETLTKKTPLPKEENVSTSNLLGDDEEEEMDDEAEEMEDEAEEMEDEAEEVYDTDEVDDTDEEVDEEEVDEEEVDESIIMIDPEKDKWVLSDFVSWEWNASPSNLFGKKDVTSTD